MIIDKNKVVTLHYQLRRDDSAGELIEETFGRDPLVFLYGAGQMIPKFEQELSGKKAGDSFDFDIDSEDAYGDYDPEAVIPLPKTSFIIDGELATHLLVPGKTIPMRDQNGRELIGTIQRIENESVIMDFNHPMAGVDLHFSGQIESIREATETELSHGHVHGPGGHNH
jgi:FKBP-type peptidyl-prolyl cis-trans isomerase SlyD